MRTDQNTLTDAVERYFRQRPGMWISMHELARIGGIGGWRTRVSQCHRERGMAFETRQSTILTADGRRLRISERKFVPVVPQEQAN